jgi:hypothetical protein
MVRTTIGGVGWGRRRRLGHGGRGVQSAAPQGHVAFCHLSTTVATCAVTALLAWCRSWPCASRRSYSVSRWRTCARTASSIAPGSRLFALPDRPMRPLYLRHACSAISSSRPAGQDGWTASWPDASKPRCRRVRTRDGPDRRRPDRARLCPPRGGSTPNAHAESRTRRSWSREWR